MKRYKYKKKNRIMLLLILVIGISVGYSLLSSNLKINGYSGINKNTWDIHWNSESIQTASGSVTPKEAAHVDQEDNKSVSFDVELELPGDFYEFTLDAKNYGSIDGAVDKVIIKFYDDNDEEIETLPPYINYSFTYNDGTPIEDNKVIKQNESEKYKFRVEFDRNAKTLPSDPTPIKPVIDVDYEQFEPRENYVITFNSSGANPPTSTRIVKKGDKIGDLTTPTKEKYSFQGWYTDPVDGTQIDKDTIPEDDVTYYAHWKEQELLLNTGKIVNTRMKKLAGNELPEKNPYNTTDTYITAITKSNTAPDISTMTEDNIMSIDEDDDKVYMWFDNGTIYYYSESGKPKLNEDASYMFYGLTNLASINMNQFNTSETTNIEYLFGLCSSLTTVDVFDTSSVTKMNYLFYNCSGITSININGFNTNNVTEMNSVFSGNRSLTSIDVSQLNTSKVTTVQSMFSSCTGLTSLDLSNWDTTSMRSVSGLVSGCTNLETIDVSNWNFTNSITSALMMTIGAGSVRTAIFDNAILPASMNYGFGGCTNLVTLSLNNIDSSNVTDMNGMFNGDRSLTSIDLSKFNTSNVTNMQNLFYGCSGLTTVDFSGVDLRKVENMGTMFYNCTSLTSVDFTSANTPALTNIEAMFTGCSGLVTLNLTGLDTASVTNMNAMVNGCTNLKTLNLSGFDFSGYDSTGFISIRYNISLLSYIGGGTIENIILDNAIFPANSKAFFVGDSNIKTISLNNVNTSKVTNMSEMFASSPITSLDLSSFDTSKVTNMSEMFASSKITSLDLSSFDISEVTNISDIFANMSKIESINISGWNFASLTNISHLFDGLTKLETINLSDVNTSTITDISYMFYNCSSLTTIDISDLDTEKVTNMMVMFYYCSGLTSINFGNIDTSKVTNMSAMFSGCTGFTSLDLSSFNTSSLTNVSSMLSGINLKKLNISNWNFSKLTDSSSIAGSMSISKNIEEIIANDIVFNNNSSAFTGLTGLKTISLNNAVFGNDMSALFLGCTSLKNISLKNVDTSQTTNMSAMFSGCTSLTKLDLSTFNTTNVTNIGGFLNSGTKELNLSNWDLSNFSENFAYSMGLSNIEKLILNNVKFGINMNQAFIGMTKLTEISLIGVDTTSTKTMENMFKNCSSLTVLDLSDFDTSSVVSTIGMFNGMTNLNTIYVGDNFNINSVTSSNIMFTGCTNLVGGAGTTYDASHIDAEYAHVDGGTSNPGYFTRMSSSYIITFNANSGIEIEPKRRVAAGTNIRTLPTPIRSGYTFDGWFTGLTDGVKVDNSYIPTGNTTLYARWIED